MINNMHTHEMVGVLNKRGEKKMNPNIIREYNEGMSGIDLADQMVSYYESLRKTTLWYKNVALHIFYIFLFNAHCLSNKYGVDKSFNLLKFRETIITDLIGDSFKEISRNKTSNTSDADYLAAVPPNEKKKIADKTMKNLLQGKTKRKSISMYCMLRKNLVNVLVNILRFTIQKNNLFFVFSKNRACSLKANYDFSRFI